MTEHPETPGTGVSPPATEPAAGTATPATEPAATEPMARPGPNGALADAATVQMPAAGTAPRAGIAPMVPDGVSADAAAVQPPPAGTWSTTTPPTLPAETDTPKAPTVIDGADRREPPAKAGPHPLWFRLVGPHLRAVAPALLGYAALRVVCMLVLWLWAQHIGADFIHLFGRFDMSAYRHIARFGYDTSITRGPDGALQPSNLAFFPLYPALIRAVVTVLPISYLAAGLAIDWIASLAAVWGMFAVGRHLYGRRVGIALGILWAVVPYAIDESMNLTESLFTALAAWSLYAVLKRRWITAGVLCAIAGLSRPTAVALIAALGVAAVIALVRREGPWWRPVVGAAISPVGWLAYIVWVALRLHRADGWFYTQKTFNSSFDGGQYTLRMIRDTLFHKQPNVEPYVVTLVLAVVVALLVVSIVQRQPVPLIIYSIVLFVTTTGGTNYFHTDPRHLLPAVPLLLPVARGLVSMRRANAVAVVAVMTCFAAWYGGFLALLWGFSY